MQLQVELGLAAVPRQLLGEQPRQAAQGTEVTLLMVEHHLEQTLLAGLRERLEQLLERQILMGLCIQCAGTGLRQQLKERQSRIHLGAQHLGVDEEADQPLGFQARTVGIGDANPDIALAAIAMQQALEPCQQQHEGRRIKSLGGLANRLAQASVQSLGVACCAAQRLGRAWMIGRQVQGRVLVAQLLLPVSQLPLALPLRQPLALPTAVIRILQRQGGKGSGLALDSGGIQVRELVDQHVQRPAIGDDVMQGHQQLVLFIVQAYQGDPE
ncbi:hypothetical protein D3C85_684730 [compost metagenome]